MLYLIDITWQRRTPEPDRFQTGVETVAMAGRSFTVAKGRAVRKFNLHFGMHLAIQKVTEKQDPAQIHEDGFKRIDCGSGQHYGICRQCGKGHGTVLMERGIFSKAIPA